MSAAPAQHSPSPRTVTPPPTLLPVPAGTLVPPQPPSTLSEKVLRVALGIAAAVALVGTLYVLRFLIGPVALAVLTFYVLSPLVSLLENRRMPRGAAVGLCFAALFGLLTVVGLALWPSLDAWLQQTPKPGEKSVFELQLAARLDAWEQQGKLTYPQLDWSAIFDGIRGVLESNRRRLMEGLPAMLMEAASSAGTFLLAPIIAVFLLLDGAAMHRRLLELVPNRWFELSLLLFHRVDRQIANYLRGTASESALVAVLLSIVLGAVGMPNAVLFALIFAVLNVVPLAGPVIGIAAGLLYSLMDPAAPSPGILLACYGGVYVLDSLLINPLVVGKNLDLHPLTIIVGITIGGALGGILGMLISIPLIAIGKAIASTLYDAWRRHRLHRLAAG